jgi:branched-chain amino acid transport system permease protein
VDGLLLAQIFFTGLATSSFAVCFALAFALVLKVLRLWNFAQAGAMGIAFYAQYSALNSFAWPLPMALLFGLALTVAALCGLERAGLRPLRRRGSSALMFFIFTLVCSEFTSYALTLLYGTEPVALYPETLSPVQLLAGVAVSDWDLRALASTCTLCAALYGYLRWSRDGQLLLAVADHAELAELYGIDAQRARGIALVLAAVCVVIGMYLYGTRSPVMPGTPMQLMLAAVIASLLGGIGRVFGAAVAALLLAQVQAFSVLFIPSAWQNLILYGALFVTILFFPRGLPWPSYRGAT